MRSAPARTLILSLFATSLGYAAPVEVTGAGSTFVYPLMAKWATLYRARAGDVINYQSIGSGGGIKQIKTATVDFGATDMPLEAEELAADGLVQVPLVAGAVLPVVHVRGVGDGALRLTGPALADIFLGKIKRWNDRRLAELNPDLALPDRLITVVHRADGSGTSYVWTTYLNAVSAEWRLRVGRATALTWPAGVGGKGNEGVASFVKQIDGAIGYVESAFAARARMTTVRLENRAGQFVSPTPEHVRAALATTDPDADRPTPVNPPGADSWPVTGVTYLLFRADRRARSGPRAARAFVRWALAEGGAAARDLHYEPLAPEAGRHALATLAAEAAR